MYLLSEYRKALERLGDHAMDFSQALYEARTGEKLTFWSFLLEPLHELPQVSIYFHIYVTVLTTHQIVFTLRAVQYPASIPVSLASLNLIQQTTLTFTSDIVRFIEQTGSIAETLFSVRKLYEMVNIPNRVVDGQEPFPENDKTLDTGISIEFKYVIGVAHFSQTMTVTMLQRCFFQIS
jgi:hypothetical protein